MKKIGLIMFAAILYVAVDCALCVDCGTDYIVNGGFEEPMVPLGVGIQNPSPEDCFWTTSDGAYSEILDDIQLGSMGYPLPPEGYQVMYCTDGKLTQNTGLTIEAGRTYKLGLRLLTAVAPLPSQYVKAGFEDENGNTIVLSQSFLPALPLMQWTQFSFTFNTALYPDSIGKTLVASLHSYAYIYADVVTLKTGLVGDLDDNCAVNVADISVIAAQWLDNNKVEQTVN